MVIELTAILRVLPDKVKEVQIGLVSKLEWSVGAVTGVAILGLLEESREGGYTGCDTTCPSSGVSCRPKGRCCCFSGWSEVKGGLHAWVRIAVPWGHQRGREPGTAILVWAALFNRPHRSQVLEDASWEVVR